MTAVAKDDEPAVSCVTERDTGRDEIVNNNDNNTTIISMSRKEKRKALKKMKRKQLRRDIALKEREEEEARLNNPEEQMRLLRLEQDEAERMERDRMEFEERERMFLEELEKKKREEEEEEERRKLCDESKAKSGDNNELDEDDEWEYIEDGPAEIIWKGNEIIVKKKKVRVRKKSLDPENVKQECDRPTSNPLAPQSEAFEDYKSAQEVLECVAQQVPNFGTEQDKAHCPFHLKTGVCRFGARCSRVHFYPDKSCTLLLKNMYSGPGLAWEHDEGLEYTDEEVELSFEDFYEDVHTEFLKFGEIVNFKVCKNSSPHLRGNVYVHYKSLESAVVAYQSVNGRYFAGKQVSCEFVNIARWKVAICGEYMKSRLKTCSRGSACNFIHCFRNPGGDYEWADWDKPAPRYWLKKMAALFGFSDDRLADEVSPRRSRSRGPDSAYSKGRADEDDGWKREHYRRHKGGSRERISEAMREEKMSSQLYHHDECRKSEPVDLSDYSSDEQKTFVRQKRSSRKRGRESELTREDNKLRKHEVDSGKNESVNKGENNRYHERSSRRSTRHKRAEEAIHDHYCKDKVQYFEPMENLDRHYDKYSRHKRKRSLPKEDADSSDIDSHGYRLEKDKHRHRSHDKRSSKQVKYDADSSDCVSDGDVSRDGRRHQKSGRRNSRSNNESGFMIIKSSRERSYRDDRLNGSARKSSRHQSEDAGLSNIDSQCHRDVDNPEEKDISSERHNDGDGDKYSSSRVNSYEGCCEYEKYDKRRDVEHRSQIDDCNEEATASQKAEVSGRHSSFLDLGESESEREQAYRLAALKKLDEMRKSKDSQPARSCEYESARTHSHDNLELKGKEVSKGAKEVLDLSKAETSAASTKRRRI